MFSKVIKMFTICFFSTKAERIAFNLQDVLKSMSRHLDGVRLLTILIDLLLFPLNLLNTDPSF